MPSTVAAGPASRCARLGGACGPLGRQLGALLGLHIVPDWARPGRAVVRTGCPDAAVDDARRWNGSGARALDAPFEARRLVEAATEEATYCLSVAKLRRTPESVLTVDSAQVDQQMPGHRVATLGDAIDNVLDLQVGDLG